MYIVPFKSALSLIYYIRDPCIVQHLCHRRMAERWTTCCFTQKNKYSFGREYVNVTEVYPYTP